MTYLITLHDADIKQFPLDNGLGVLSDVISAQVEEELNGLFDVAVEYDIEGALAEEIEQERIIKLMAQDKLGYQLFRIHTVEKSHEGDRLIVHARHITYDLANNFVEELNAQRMTKKQVMEMIGASAVEPHPFNITSSNTTTVSSTRLYRTNPLQMIGGMDGSVLQIWGGQIERDNFNLVMHDRRGHDDGVTVTYEKNITGLNAEFDYSGLVTRIFPFVLVEATEDEPERLITVSGKYIDSPLINAYNKVYMAPVDYSHDDRIDTQDKTDAQIRTQLQAIAERYFDDTGNDKPRINIDVKFAHLWDTEEYREFAPLEQVGMGDTVTVKHSRLGIDVTATVNYIKYDAVAGVNIEVGLGDVKADFSDNVSKIDTIERKVEQAESNANQAIISANGKNTTYYGPDEPTSGMQKGDLWFKIIDGQYTRTYRFDGIEWQLILDMDSQEAKAEAQQAKDDAQNAVDRANQATEDANAAIGQAQASFDLAQANATTIDSLGLQIGNVEDGLTTISGTVDGLQTTVSDVQGNVANLTVISNAMQTRLSDAEGNINTLTLTSQSMQSTIGVLQNNARTNLLKNSKGDNLDGWSARSRSELRIVDGVIRVRKGGSPSHYGVITNQGLELESGKTYTLSLDIASNFRTSVLDYVYILYNDGQGNQRIDDIVMTNAHDDFKRYSISFTPNRDCDDCSILLGAYVKEDGYATEGFLLRKVQVEQGPVATPWTPSYLDLATQSQITQLSDAINLRVMKGDVINQINLDTTGVLISGKKLILDGDTTVLGTFKLDGSAHIKNASIGTAQIAFIDAAKINSGELNTNNITIFGGSATNYTHIQGSTIDLRGTYTRVWRGHTTTHDVLTRLHKGHLRFRNDNLDRSLYMSEFGISTYLDGEGESGGSSGTILWWDKTYSPSNSNGITMHSHGGVVALASNTSHVVLDSYQSAQVLSKNSGVMINPYDNLTQRHFWFTKSTNGLNGYLVFGLVDRTGLRFDGGSDGIVQVVDSNNRTGGTTTIEAGTGLFNDVVRRGDGASVYFNATGGGTLNTGTRLISDGIVTTSTNFYLGVDGELRVTNKRGYNPGGSITYMPIKASALTLEQGATLGGTLNITSGYIYVSQVRVRDDLTNMYISPSSSGQLRVTASGTTNVYRPVRASSFIGNLEGNALTATTATNLSGGSVNATSLGMPYTRTDPGTANLVIKTNNQIYRATSARKYKKDIYDITLAEANNFLDNVVPIKYKNAVDLSDDNIYYGYVADDVATVDPRMVQFGDDGQPEGFNYDRVPALLHVVLKNEIKRIDSMEQALNKSDDRLSVLELKVQLLEQKIKLLEVS